jgi:AraC-like DNA-binding protein
MEKTQSIEEFYQSKLNWMPDNLQKEMGHFNVFRIEDFAAHTGRALPYSRKDFFKISLIIGKTRIHYADKVVTINERALLFANPHIPYTWEQLEDNQVGAFCIFTEAFFNHFGALKDYPVFKPGGSPIFDLPEEQTGHIRDIFEKMFVEINSEYTYKYDVLRNLVFELVHSAQKMQPATSTLYTGSNAATRVSTLFMELLERQFPIESPMQQLKFRSPTEFANQLAVHVNHLNRALKEVTGKTTSQLIAERVVQEARALLKHTDWNISEIAWCLGFEELPHFINFFKKNAQITPKSFRMAIA